MGLEISMNLDAIRAYLEKEVRAHQQRLISMLQYVGQTVVNEIRTSHISNWNDQTGNLRSSIGYTVILDGVPQITSAFEQVDGPKREETKENGSQDGKNFLDSLIPLYPHGIALVIVAGMEYASYVEKMENKTVLAQGEVEAEKLIASMIQQLNAKYDSH